MVDKNPLELSNSKGSNQIIRNKRGRPRKKDVTKFGSLPKSIIITEMLKKISEDAHSHKSNQRERDLVPLWNNSLVKVNLEEDTEDNRAITKAEDCDNDDKREIFAGIYCRKKSQDQWFTCDYLGCQYSCKLSCNLIKHKRIHTLEKPYMCDKCTFRSNFSNSLKVHKRLHTKEKPFKCKHCSYQCNSSSNLQKHCSHKHSKEFKNESV